VSTYISVYARVINPGTASVSGYRVVADSLGSVTQIFRVDNGADTQLGSNITTSWGAGDAVGIEIIGTTIKSYRKPSGGSWGLVDTQTDSTYTGSGNIGLRTLNATVRGDDFGGGTVFVAGAWIGRRLCPVVIDHPEHPLQGRVYYRTAIPPSLALQQL